MNSSVATATATETATASAFALDYGRATMREGEGSVQRACLPLPLFLSPLCLVVIQYAAGVLIAGRCTRRVAAVAFSRAFE